jgi:hypothetical protein
MTGEVSGIPAPSGLTARKVAKAVLFLILVAAAIALRLWGGAQHGDEVDERQREFIDQCLATTQPGQQAFTCVSG